MKLTEILEEISVGFRNGDENSKRLNEYVDMVRNSLQEHGALYENEKINSLSTSRASAFRLFEDALNLKSTTIYDLVKVDDKDKRVLNQVETLYAREKQNQIKELFKDWIFKDPARRDVLEEEYNNIFNQTSSSARFKPALSKSNCRFCFACRLFIWL